MNNGFNYGKIKLISIGGKDLTTNTLNILGIDVSDDELILDKVIKVRGIANAFEARTIDETVDEFMDGSLVTYNTEWVYIVYRDAEDKVIAKCLPLSKYHLQVLELNDMKVFF